MMRTATGLYHHQQVPVCHQVPAQQLHHQEFACLDRSPENKVPAIWAGLCPPATPVSRTGTASRGSVGGWRMTRSWALWRRNLGRLWEARWQSKSEEEFSSLLFLLYLTSPSKHMGISAAGLKLLAGDCTCIASKMTFGGFNCSLA